MFWVLWEAGQKGGPWVDGCSGPFQWAGSPLTSEGVSPVGRCGGDSRWKGGSKGSAPGRSSGCGLGRQGLAQPGSSCSGTVVTGAQEGGLRGPHCSDPTSPTPL